MKQSQMDVYVKRAHERWLAVRRYEKMRELNDARDESDEMREIWDYAMGKRRILMSRMRVAHGVRI
jgi:hypothetical protein